MTTHLSASNPSELLSVQQLHRAYGDLGLLAVVAGTQGISGRIEDDSQPGDLGVLHDPDVEGHDRSAHLDVALEVDAARIDLVGLALGQRVFSLHYDGKTLKSWRHPMWPAQLRAEQVLENLQLTLWPVNAIRQALPIGWSIQESGLRRTILQDGLAVMVIDYSALPVWSGKVEVANLQFDYRITIQSVPNEP